MREAFDGIKKSLILRKLRSSCLEGRTARIQTIVNFLAASKAGIPIFQPHEQRIAGSRLSPGKHFA
jgi:hypothetical protein